MSYVAGPEVVVHPDAETLAGAIAERLLATLTGAQSAGRTPSVVLTGGGLGTALLRATAASPSRDTVDWSRVDLWWGDERFLPAGDPERNETGARDALLDSVPVDPSRVHPMPATDEGHGTDPEAAARRYAAELAVAAGATTAPAPPFDVVLLGVGPDGHVASLFPGQPAVHANDPVVAVHDAPKPPPTRTSLTLPALNAGKDVWFCVAGADKALAVGRALAPDATVDEVPACGPRGRRRTLWLLDSAAAAEVPTDLR